MNIIFSSDQSNYALLECFTLAVAYVGSLYIYPSNLPRDHNTTIKRRMFGVAVVCFLSPILVYILSSPNGNGYTLTHWLGMHSTSFLSIVLPLILTMVLFAGPITLLVVREGFNNVIQNFIDLSAVKDIKWHRTYIVAPFTEEFIFRACMLPVLVPNFGLKWSIFLAPLFFGVAHFHHKIEQLKQGYDLRVVVLSGMFQMAYTTIFGAYSAFLFLRTGNLIGPVLCHSFCNFMGFPDFPAIFVSRYPKFISFIFVLGLVLFVYLLFPLTNPTLYDSIYWTSFMES